MLVQRCLRLGNDADREKTCKQGDHKTPTDQDSNQAGTHPLEDGRLKRCTQRETIVNAKEQ